MSSLFDDIDDIFDDEEENVFECIEIHNFNKFIDKWKLIPMEKYDRWRGDKIQHTINVNELEYAYTLTVPFNANISKHIIVCPLSFIINSPVPIKYITVDDIKTYPVVMLVMYCEIYYNKEDRRETKILTHNDINLLRYIEPKDGLKIGYVAFSGTFESLDVYNEFICLNLFKNVDDKIYLHYDTKIIIDGQPVLFQNILKDGNIPENILLHNGKVELSYSGFITDCIISEN